MTEEQEEMLKKSFEAMDTDGNGTLSKDELITYFYKTLKDRKKAKERAESILKAMGSGLNKDMITFRDFKRLQTHQAMHEGGDQLLKDAFLKLSDNTSNVPINKFTEYIKQTDSNMDDIKIQNIIKTVDDNNDGRITFDEFKIAFKSLDI